MNDTKDKLVQSAMPCPFCGKKASLDTYKRYVGGGAFGRRRRYECSFRYYCAKGCAQTLYYKRESTCLKRWNTRFGSKVESGRLFKL